MKLTLQLLLGIMMLPILSFSQVFESEIIIDNLEGSNGVIYHDFNDDGILEYIVTRFSQDVVSLLFWDGIQFVEKDLISIDEPNGMALGDFNEDGRIDIAVTASNISGIRILRNQGNFEFSVQTLNTFDYDNAGAIAATDFDLDGDLDLVVSSYKRDDVAIFEMINPDFFTFDVKIIDNDSDSRDLNIEDLDNDGLPDIVSSNRFGNELNIYFNQGGNNFQKNTYALNGAINADIADFNNDGFLDIGVTSFSNSDLSVFLNNADRTFEEKLIDGSVQNANSISCFDIDNDNISDIVVGNNEGIVVFLIKDINNNEHVREDYFYDGWIGPFDVVDIDGDNDLDLVASSSAIPGIIHYINKTLISSLNGIDDLAINIYPNPTNEVIHIEGILNYNMNLFDLNGKTIISKRGSNKLHVSSIPAGTYLLEITDSKTGQKAIEKLIIEK